MAASTFKMTLITPQCLPYLSPRPRKIFFRKQEFDDKEKITKYKLIARFYISLTVHLGKILVNNQLEALFLCIYLFHFSTCFEQPSAHHQENQFYQPIIWYISLCVGDCLVCRSGRNFLTGKPGSHLHRVIYTR